MLLASSLPAIVESQPNGDDSTDLTSRALGLRLGEEIGREGGSALTL